MLGPEWKYCITLNTQDYAEIQDWCLENLGEFDDKWYKLGIDPAGMVLSHLTPKTIWYFKEEKDAVLFSLRWL